MSEKWTKGPWEIRKYKDPYGSRNLAVEILTDEIIIAKLGIEIDEECAANAHLIAAAPEMYALLERVKDELVYHLSFSENAKLAVKAESFGVEIFSLLKKARGES